MAGGVSGGGRHIFQSKLQVTGVGREIVANRGDDEVTELLLRAEDEVSPHHFSGTVNVAALSPSEDLNPECRLAVRDHTVTLQHGTRESRGGTLGGFCSSNDDLCV